jgi:hypothetical protein
MNRTERLVEIKKAHQRYVDWWLPIDVAGGSFMAPMSYNSFCETLLTNDGGWFSAESTIENWWNEWLPDFTEPKEKSLMKRCILENIIGYYLHIADLNEK